MIPPGLSTTPQSDMANSTISSDSCNSTLSPPDDAQIAFNVLTVALLPYGILIIIANGVVLAAILFTKKLHKKMYMFNVSLACADLTVGMVCLVKVFLVLQPGAKSCLLRIGLIIGPCVCSSFCMMCIALDRYIAIRSPLTHALAVTKGKITMVILTAWVAGLTLGLAPVLGWQSRRPAKFCSFLYVMDPSYIFTLAIAGFILPFGVILGIYGAIFRETRKHIKTIEAQEYCLRSSSPAFSQRNLKALKTLAAVVGSYFVAWFPFVIASLIHSFYVTIYSDTESFVEVGILRTITGTYLLLLGLTNCLLNPCVYALKNRDFRKVIIERWCRYTKRRNSAPERPNRSPTQTVRTISTVRLV